MTAVVDMSQRLRGTHREVLARHPSGKMMTASGMPLVRICAECGTPWPCVTIRHLNTNK